MTGHEHHAIVTLAFQSLPGSSLWKRRSLESEVRSACMLPDEVAIPLLRGEKGPWRQYFPLRLPKFNFEKRGRTARTFIPPNRFYLSRVLDLLRSDSAEAARFAGVYSHYVGDFAQPIHYYELDIGILLPPPPSMRNCEYHRMVEDIPSDVSEMRYRPRLLGTSVDEAIFRLDGQYGRLFRQSVGAVVPMVRAIYSRQNERATRVLNRVVAQAAKLYADVLHTLDAISGSTFPPRDLKALRTCDLRGMEPHAFDVEFNFGNRPLIDLITPENYGRSRPFVLRMPGGTNARVPGICGIPHALPLQGIEPVSSIVYRLPRGVYRRFEAVVGLLADKKPQAPSRFEVIADGDRRYRSGVMSADTPAAEVSVDISGCRTLTLRVETDGSTDKLAFPVWGRPVLLRREVP